MTSLDAIAAYNKNIHFVAIFQKYGPLGVKVIGKQLFQRSFIDRIRMYAMLLFAAISGRQLIDVKPIVEFIKHRIVAINHMHQQLSSQSSAALKAYFSSATTIKAWNKCYGFSIGFGSSIQKWLLKKIGIQWNNLITQEWKIKYKEQIPIHCSLSSSIVSCSIVNSQRLPLVVSPKNSSITQTDFLNWANAHQKEIKEALETYGAILLRGFPVESPDQFATVVKAALGRDPNDYAGGEGSRRKVAQGVYTSTEAPAWFHIPLHHELSCTQDPAKFICFFCSVAPAPGTGQTILGSTAQVTKALRKQSEVWSLFENKTIEYISRHPPRGSLITRINKTHKTWQDAFETEDKKRVEEICQRKKFAWRWRGEWLEVTRHAPSMHPDPLRPSHQLWYNQSHLYDANPRLRMGWLNHIAAELIYCRKSTRQYEVRFSDGSSIPRRIFYKIYDTLQASTVHCDWQKGDVMLVDNLRAMHGKFPHRGARSILTALVS